jgi:hypothetical protein
MGTERQIRTQIAISTMAQTRAELRNLFNPEQDGRGESPPSIFPRSKTFRWALSHPARRILGNGLGAAVSRVLLARFIGKWALGRRS